MTSKAAILCELTIVITLMMGGVGLSAFSWYDFCNDDMYNLARFMPYIPNNNVLCIQSIISTIFISCVCLVCVMVVIVSITTNRTRNAYERIY